MNSAKGEDKSNGRARNILARLSSWIKLHKKTVVRWTVLIVAIVAIGGYVLYVATHPPIVPNNIAKQVGFTVYAPKRTPTGYTSQYDTAQQSSSMVTYTLTNKASDAEIVVTVQPMPQGFDMMKMIGDGSISGSELSVGRLYNLTTSDANQFLLETGDSLVFLTASQRIDTAPMRELVESFARYH